MLTATEDVSLESIAKFQLIQAEKLLTRITNFLETPKGTNFISAFISVIILFVSFISDFLSNLLSLFLFIR